MLLLRHEAKPTEAAPVRGPGLRVRRRGTSPSPRGRAGNGAEDAKSREKRPRDAQRRRVYLAETPLPSSPLPGLDACAAYADRVVGTLWWEARFPRIGLADVPRFRPGHGARQAFFSIDQQGPAITLPRRYRTKGVVLHELVHWAMAEDADLPAHGRTFARVLLDATSEFLGPARAHALLESYAEHRVHLARPPRLGPSGHLHYGWDERLRLHRGKSVVVHHRTEGLASAITAGMFVGYERGNRYLRLLLDGDEPERLPTDTVWDVQLPVPA
jgi:putative metallohydrolase (TIGR04338 family)